MVDLRVNRHFTLLVDRKLDEQSELLVLQYYQLLVKQSSDSIVTILS